jgi:hypothetical protein
MLLTATIMDGQRPVPIWFLEQYLALVSNSDGLGMKERLDQSIVHRAELNYRLHGGGRCALCHSSVRHVVGVTIEKNGRLIPYSCLCTRCMEGERATSERTILRLGRASLELTPRQPELTVKRWVQSESQVSVPKHG